VRSENVFFKLYKFSATHNHLYLSQQLKVESARKATQDPDATARKKIEAYHLCLVPAKLNSLVVTSSVLE